MQDKTTQTETAQPTLSCSQETAAVAVAERCFNDKAFGEKFLADPKAALAEQNIKTDRRQVHAHKNDAQNWHIVLPNLKAREALGGYAADELSAMSEADMRKLSGGEIAATVALVVGIGAAAGAVTTGVVAGTAVGVSRNANKKK